ncbi:MAG: RagB/SusD family nutrient uptake outer membrane protein [Chitinophagaceae bacterium]|nr:RagB/SusD family nutrient uptake outer membrane protein [Chitinophagaceae bacterium]
MKKYFLILAVVVASSSCKKDFLDTTPLDQLNESSVWQDPNLARKVINGRYQALPPGHTYFMMFTATDEGLFQYDDLGSPYTKGFVTPDALGCFGSSVWAWGQQDWNWDKVYSNIRNINLALANIDGVPYVNEADKSQAKGELFFLRAFSYYLLFSQYGGVPLYETAPKLGEDYTKPRNTFEETVNFIVSDLDNAANLMTASIGVDKTKADKGVALALKSRVLLYAASDLHNNGLNGVVTGGYSNPELLGYTGGDASARWQAAKDAAKAVIDLGAYSLYTANADVVRNFEEVFLKRSNEDIFLKYGDKLTDIYYGLDRTPLWCNTVGFGGGANEVLGEIVDAFEMSDGSKFDWNNPVHAINPYANRDPRLYASVLFEGSPWYDRSSTNNKVSVGVWPDGSTGPDFYRTGYYMRKYIDKELGVPDYFNYPGTSTAPFVRMRYAEILLNYAEACIELGLDEEAKTYINMVRDRAGMPPVTETGSALRERYRNERRVELAFEEHRFFDIRRWLIGPQTATAHGVSVSYPVNGSFDNPVFTPIEVDEGRAWADKTYFLPISTDELNKNTALIQNPGY